jgi:hypothetical protein
MKSLTQKWIDDAKSIRNNQSSLASSEDRIRNPKVYFKKPTTSGTTAQTKKSHDGKHDYFKIDTSNKSNSFLLNTTSEEEDEDDNDDDFDNKNIDQKVLTKSSKL